MKFRPTTSVIRRAMIEAAYDNGEARIAMGKARFLNGLLGDRDPTLRIRYEKDERKARAEIATSRGVHSALLLMLQHSKRKESRR